MMTLGFFSVLVLMAAVALQLSLGIRLDGWLGIVLGAAGIAYCYLASPSYGLIPVFFAASVILLYGFVGTAIRLWRQWRAAAIQRSEQ
jgi:hypothetical protein